MSSSRKKIMQTVSLTLCVLVSTVTNAQDSYANEKAHLKDPKAICASMRGQAAINACTSIIAKNLNDEWAYFNRGSAHKAAGHLEKATNDYREALRINPNNQAAARELSNIQSSTTICSMDKNTDLFETLVLIGPAKMSLQQIQEERKLLKHRYDLVPLMPRNERLAEIRAIELANNELIKREERYYIDLALGELLFGSWQRINNILAQRLNLVLRVHKIMDGSCLYDLVSPQGHVYAERLPAGTVVSHLQKILK